MTTAPNIHPLIQANLDKFKGRFEAWEYDSEKMQLFCAYYPENTQIEPHTHETNNCGVIIQGEMFLTVDGVEKSYKVGDWYEVKAGVVHSARTEVLTTEIEFWFKK
jgi:mannose-6-phosphate isomerase-like protein (cupin superfamily)